MEIQFEQNMNFNQFHRDHKNGRYHLNDDEIYYLKNVNAEDIEDEKISSGFRPKRNFWNSVTFDNDDLVSGISAL